MLPPTSPSNLRRGPSWRFLRGWDAEELDRAFERASKAKRNFDPRPGAMARGAYRHVCSRARVAMEPPGPPVPGGTFERLWEAIQRFEHSDPRIVVAHFRRDEPLRGRIVLLEIRVLGLRYLCPVRIAAVRSHANPTRTLRAIALDTLEGHLERGREWFFLRKDHETGEIRFRVQAAWRTGDFPNAWSHAGFLVLAPRYQRAWHRLTHLRLRRIAAGLAPHVEAFGPIFHADEPMPAEPIRFYSGRIPPRELDVEREEEGMHAGRYIEPLLLGAYSGIRSLTGPAVAVRHLDGSERRHRALRGLLSVLAANEFLVDKLPGIPPRTHPLSLAARAISGAFVASVGEGSGRARSLRGLLGAAGAVASAHLFTALRIRALRRSRLFGHALALAEDGLVLLARRRLASGGSTGGRSILVTPRRCGPARRRGGPAAARRGPWRR